MRIYLDACSLNRLTDDQSQARIRSEADAVEQFFQLVRSGRIEWISSDALLAEVSCNPSLKRRHDVEVLLPLATETISFDAVIVERARQLELAGYGAFDALHLSAAEAGRAEALFLQPMTALRAVRNVASERRAHGC